MVFLLKHCPCVAGIGVGQFWLGQECSVPCGGGVQKLARLAVCSALVYPQSYVWLFHAITICLQAKPTPVVGQMALLGNIGIRNSKFEVMSSKFGVKKFNTELSHPDFENVSSIIFDVSSSK